jgi:hypothetical protein
MMKRNSGVFLLFSSFAFTAIGSIARIKHTAGSQAFLLLGILTFVIAMVMILMRLLKKN